MSPGDNFPEKRILTSKEKIETFLKGLAGQRIPLADGKETRVLVDIQATSYCYLEFQGYPGALLDSEHELREKIGNYFAIVPSRDSVSIDYVGVKHPDLVKGGAFLKTLSLFAEKFPSNFYLEMEVVHEGTTRRMESSLEKLRQQQIDMKEFKAILLKNKLIEALTLGGFNKILVSFILPTRFEIKAKKDPTIKEIQIEVTGNL